MTQPAWFSALQEPVLVGPESRGIGLTLPGRFSDCSGRRPSWFPFQINVCDEDTAAPPPLTLRERAVPGFPSGRGEEVVV